MLSAIRKFFHRSGHHQPLDEQQQQEKDQQKESSSEKKLERKLQRQLKHQRKEDKRRSSSRRQSSTGGGAASEAGAPLKGPLACDIAGSSEGGGSNTSSDASGSSSNSDESDSSSGGSKSSSSSTEDSRDDIDGSYCHGEGQIFANVVAMDGDNADAKQQQQLEGVENGQGRTEVDDIDAEPGQQGAYHRDPDNCDEDNAGEDEDLDEPYDDCDLLDEDEDRVAFIAEAPTTQQHYQHLQQQHQQQQHKQQQQHHQQQQQQSDRLTATSQAAVSTTTGVQQPRKTDVDQLLTGSTANAAQKRDRVRGNLEELRVAESVNYRPVVYKYSFRVADVPANMRVFTDPDDRRIEAIARSCESQIQLEKLPIRGVGSLRMRKVTIQSPDLHSLEKCCRQFDDRFPHFYVSGGLGLSSKSIQRVYVDELAEQQQQLLQQY